jgi:hypothetical protein
MLPHRNTAEIEGKEAKQGRTKQKRGTQDIGNTGM